MRLPAPESSRQRLWPPVPSVAASGPRKALRGVWCVFAWAGVFNKSEYFCIRLLRFTDCSADCMGAAPAPIPAPPLAPGPPGSGSCPPVLPAAALAPGSPGSGSGPRSSSRQRLLPPVPSAGPESSLGRTRFPRPDPSLPSAGPESSLGRTRVFPRPDPIPSAGPESSLLRYHSTS